MLGFLSSDSLQLYLRSRYLSRLERLKALEEERPDLMVVVSSIRCMTNDVLMKGGSDRVDESFGSLVRGTESRFSNIGKDYWAVLQCSVYDKKNQLLLDNVNTLSTLGIDSINVKASSEGIIDYELLIMLLKRIPNYLYSSNSAFEPGIRNNVESIFDRTFFDVSFDPNASIDQKQRYAIDKFIKTCSVLTEKGIVPFFSMENKIRPMILSLDFNLVYGQLEINVQLPSLIALDVNVLQRRHVASGGTLNIAVALEDVSLKVTKVTPLKEGSDNIMLELKIKPEDNPYLVITDRTTFRSLAPRIDSSSEPAFSLVEDASSNDTVRYASLPVTLPATVPLDYSQRNVFSADTIIDSPASPRASYLGESDSDSESDSTTLRIEYPKVESSLDAYRRIRIVPVFEMDRYANTDSFFLRRDQNDSDLLNVVDAGTLVYKGRQIKLSFTFEQAIRVLGSKNDDAFYEPRIKAMEEEDKIIASLLSFYD